MTIRYFSNTTTIGTLTGPVAASAVTLTVQGFAQYPAVPFTVTLDRNTATEEIALVTAVNGSTLSVTRGFDGSAGQAHAAGATVEHTAGAIEFSEANQHVNASAGVHGTTGDLVGSEGAQDIFDKTLVSPILQADETAGDALVAYDPTGDRNLFRGMNAAGDDVFVVDTNGKLSAQQVQATGAISTGGALGGGTLAVGGAATVTGLLSASGLSVAGAATVAGPLTANGGVTVPSGQTVQAPTVIASGAITGQTVEVSDHLILDQVSIDPAAASGKRNVYARTDGGVYLGVSARVPVAWGSGTVFPASPLPGDIFQRSDIGALGGSFWRYTGNASAGLSGWWPLGGELLLTSMTNRPTAASALLGMSVRALGEARTYVCVQDATSLVYYWSQLGVNFTGISTANCYVRRVEGVASAAVDGNSEVTIALSPAFAAVPLSVSMTAADNAGGLAALQPVSTGGLITASQIVGRAFQGNGASAAGTVKVAYVVIGYNT